MPVGGTAFFGQNQSPRITTTYLNQLNRHGDPAPGVLVSTAQVSGSIVQPYGGFVGGKLTITNPFAGSFADPAVGPLYGGVYMYVQFNPTSTVPNLPGQIVYWSNILQYVVSAQYVAASMAGQIAGVTINPTTPGNWDFIQIAGIAMVLVSALGNIGDLIDVVPASPPTTIAGTTPTTSSLGIAVLSAPVANQLTPILLNIANGQNF